MLTLLAFKEKDVKFITVCYCVHCQSQVRLNDGLYVGYSLECTCANGLEKKDVRFFSLISKFLKSVFGFIVEDNNSIVTYAQATAYQGRFTK